MDDTRLLIYSPIVSAHIGPLQLLVQAQRGVLASSIEKQIPPFKQGEQVHCKNK